MHILTMAKGSARPITDLSESRPITDKLRVRISGRMLGLSLARL